MNAIRSAIISFSLQDNNVIAKLSALNGASGAAVKSFQGLDVTGHKAQNRIRELSAISGANAVESKKVAEQTTALNGFFGQMDHAAGSAAASQTLLGRATYGVQDALRNMSGSIQSAGQSLVNFSENNKMALAAVSALSSGMIYQTTQTAAKQESIQASFKAMAAKQGADADQLLANMRSSTNNMVSDLDLMQNTISAMSFGIPLEKIPASLELARKAQLATGQDMNYILQSLYRGVGRLSPLIIDNLGLQVSLEEANDKYAKTLGTSAANLTKEQQIQALLNATLEKGKTQYSSIDISSAKASDSFGQFSTAITNLSGEIGKTFLPAMSGAAKALAYLTVAVKDHPWATFTIAVGLAGAALGTMALLALPAVVKGLVMLTGGTFWATLSTQGLTAALKASKVAMVAGVIYSKLLAGANWILSGSAWTAAAGLWAMLAPFAAIGLAGVAVFLILQDLWTGINGGKSVIMDFAGWLYGLYDSLGIFKIALGPIAAMIEGAKAMIWVFQNWREIPGIISGAITGAVDYLKGLPSIFFDAGAGLFRAFVAGLKSVPILGTVISTLEGVRSYLPFSDAKVGPLADITLSGQRFMQTFGAGAQSQQGYLSSLMGGLLKLPEVALDFTKPMMPGFTIPASAGSQTNAAQGSQNSIYVTITGNTISGDAKSLEKLGSVTVDAVEKALDKIIGKQARAAGL